MSPFDAVFTVDLEPDCPPFLSGFRGVEQGLPALIRVLDDRGIRATFFTTGDVARRYPDAIRGIVDGGHELGCHAMSHRAFTSMDVNEARAEIEDSAAILRRFAPVTSFRAPYLRFPPAYLHLLTAAAFTVDSSEAIYKRSPRPAASLEPALRRVPASITSSALRIPRVLSHAYLRLLASPVVLFVHPWEFVDLRAERIRYDCRFRTGSQALECVGDSLDFMTRRGARFRLIRDFGGPDNGAAVS